jgi:sigma-B regulation protein RsbU (phosphoserine phosphatase)
VASLGDVQSPGTGTRWYRLHLKLPSHDAPLALLLTSGDGTFEVYANGQRMPGPELRTAWHVTYPMQRIVSLDDYSGDLELALRTSIPDSSLFEADRGVIRVEIGTPAVIDRAYQSAFSKRMNATILGIAVHSMSLLLGIAILTLFNFQRSHREYLWLGCYLVCSAVATTVFELSVAGFLPFSAIWFLADPLVYLITILQMEFTLSFAGRPVGKLWRIYEALLLIPPVFLLLPSWNGILSRGLFDLIELLIIIPVPLAMPILLFLWYRAGNREAGWLIVPSLFPVLSLAAVDLGTVLSYFGWRTSEFFGSSFVLGPLSLQLFDLADALFLIAIGIVIFLRFTRVSRDQARGAAELEAAREIQQRLVPTTLPSTLGCRIEAAYFPANEVGGDFYQVIPQSGGATLIVLGDVSGKGLKAAMAGAVAIGAVRTLASEDLSPGAMMRRLNQQMVEAGNDGFITCLILRISPGGSLTIANAGHLSPYLNGKEVATENGLPLGLASGVDYAETVLQLSRDDRLTLITDGVLEARNAAGELFGFDRTAAISVHTADQIAESAKHFGQDDDITVLSLTRLAAW